MVAPTPRYRKSLTLNIRYRKTMRGKLILQVEECWDLLHDFSDGVKQRGVAVKWRDATTEDSMHLPIRIV